jgi:hypothetical protein
LKDRKCFFPSSTKFCHFKKIFGIFQNYFNFSATFKIDITAEIITFYRQKFTFNDFYFYYRMLNNNNNNIYKIISSAYLSLNFTQEFIVVAKILFFNYLLLHNKEKSFFFAVIS